MKPTTEPALSTRLASHVHAAERVPDAASEVAQQRLLARLGAQARPQRSRLARPWLALATSLLVAVAVVLAVPMLSTGSQAFAAVQQHFRDFRTLAMAITQRHDGAVVQTTRTLVNADGVSRTDVGSQLSIIVDPRQGRVLTLLHDDRQAMLAEIPATLANSDAALRWLDDLRVFKGKATPIAESRQVDGQAARGWRLDVGGSTLELWADEDGLPLLMRQPGGAGLEIDYRFTFNAAIAEGALSSTPPPGYRLVDAAAD